MLDKKNLPRHIAIIMDGNRRWAKEKKLPVFVGHRKGEEAIEPVIDKAIELKIPYLTLWAFSTENWGRTKKEVEFLLNLYRKVLNKKIDKFHKKSVKIHVLGNISMFPSDIQKLTKSWIEKTKNNRRITVNFALSYGGRDEIIRAIYKWHEMSNVTQKQFNNLTIEQFSKLLDTASQPDPDLLIRTGGEKRLSGFLLWQIAYSELYFTKTLWPDFTPTDFEKALIEYQRRQRRFGK